MLLLNAAPHCRIHPFPLPDAHLSLWQQTTKQSLLCIHGIQQTYPEWKSMIFLLPNSLLSMCPLMVVLVATAAPAVSHTCSSGPKLQFSNEATTSASTVPAVGNMANFTLDVPLMLLWVVTRHSRLHCCRWPYLFERRWTWVPLLFFWGGGLESLLEEQSHSNQMVVTSRIGEFFLEAFFKYKSNVVTDAGL